MSESTVSIAGLDKAEVLAALYNASKPQGMGFVHYDSTPMTAAQADQLLRERYKPDHYRNGAVTAYFDYLYGRVMKLTIPMEGDTLDVRGYDRDNGQGAAERALSALREAGTEAPAIIEQSLTNTEAARGDLLDNHLRQLGSELMTLKNGAQMVPVQVVANYNLLVKLIQTDPIGLYELVMKARSDDHKLFGQYAAKLELLGALQYGLVRDDLKQVILSAVTGDGLAMALGVPFALTDEEAAANPTAAPDVE